MSYEISSDRNQLFFIYFITHSKNLWLVLIDRWYVTCLLFSFFEIFYIALQSYNKSDETHTFFFKKKMKCSNRIECLYIQKKTLNFEHYGLSL